jgi:hypothetical protein
MMFAGTPFPYESVCRRPSAGKDRSAGCLPGDHETPKTADGVIRMSKKILSAAILAGLLVGLAAPLAQAKSEPKTKAECEKITGMKWDDSTSKCVKK